MTIEMEDVIVSIDDSYAVFFTLRRKSNAPN